MSSLWTWSFRSSKGSSPTNLATPDGGIADGKLPRQEGSPSQVLAAASPSIDASNVMVPPALTATRVVVRCMPAASADGENSELVKESANAHDVVTLRLGVPNAATEKPAYAEELKRCRADGPRFFHCNAFFDQNAPQQEVFGEAMPVVEHAAAGQNGSIICSGATKAGKTDTMFGPPDGCTGSGAAASGLAQWASRYFFEKINERSSRGDVFVVEASFLQIGASVGDNEKLYDLLSSEDRRLEVKQDLSNQFAFACDGLRRVAVRSPAEMCDVISQGKRQSALLEKSSLCKSSQSHCIFMLFVENLSADLSTSATMVQRSKLFFADLMDSAMAKSLAISINTANLNITPGVRESALLKLLNDTVGATARTLLIASVSPELDRIDEVVKTLSFTEKIVYSETASTESPGEEQLPLVSVPITQPDFHREMMMRDQNSALTRMKTEHAETMKLLHQEVSDSRTAAALERKQLQADMELLSKRLKDSTIATKADVQNPSAQASKGVTQAKQVVTEKIHTEFDQLSQDTSLDLNKVKEAIAHRVSSVDAARQQRVAENEKRIAQVQAELQDAMRKQRQSEEEAATLRVQLASAKERATVLQERQDELRKERADFEEERKSLRSSNDERWRQISAIESELQRSRLNTEKSRHEIEKIKTVKTEEIDVLQQERLTWKKREDEMREEIFDLQRRQASAKCHAEVQAIKAESDHREMCEKLDSNIRQLKIESIACTDQQAHADNERKRLEKECLIVTHQEVELKQKVDTVMKGSQESLQKQLLEARDREQELLKMLHEVQESIIHAQAEAEEEDEQTEGMRSFKEFISNGLGGR